MRNTGLVFSSLALTVCACSGSATGPLDASGGTLGNGGAVGSGGNVATSSGGTIQSNGGATRGGSYGVGGSMSGGAATNGGTSANGNGGVPANGGALGGTKATGGNATNGGAVATGGKAAAGGAVATGGKAANGGAVATGGKAAGGGSSGGVPATGGAPANGGVPAAGGTVGACSRAVGSCSAPTVQVTDVSLGIPVTGYGREGDTDPLPLAIASMPSGGSRVAWLGTDAKVYVAQLDCDDKLVGTPFSVPGIDLQDIHADDNGGVVLLTRNATNGGTDNCGTGTLCGGSSSPCRTMWMVRFDNAGNVTWETQVTNLSSSLAGYQNGARFVWWYQHHGRLAFDGTNYAAYFGVAITVNNGSCVDIHEGDRMQVVSSSGALLTGHDSFEVGCSHSWQSRIVWDPRSSHFSMVCATDNNCRLAQPNPYRTVATATCDGTFFGGDLVLSSSSGYWTAWSQSGAIRLAHFTTGAADTNIANAGSSQHPHLVSYGTGKMLLAWGSGTSIAAQVRDAGATGDVIGSQFTIGVNDHNYQAFKSYADGSVAYPAVGANNTSIKIARVMSCN